MQIGGFWKEGRTVRPNVQQTKSKYQPGKENNVNNNQERKWHQFEIIHLIIFSDHSEQPENTPTPTSCSSFTFLPNMDMVVFEHLRDCALENP